MRPRCVLLHDVMLDEVMLDNVILHVHDVMLHDIIPHDVILHDVIPHDVISTIYGMSHQPKATQARRLRSSSCRLGKRTQ